MKGPDLHNNDRIDLAHTADFTLGGLTIRPGTRQIAGAEGTSEIVEPRVMQVLVALARVRGDIVSRDDLTASCWEDRIVGEDAINRVISRLRRVAETTGGQFRVETITKVGYRLIDSSQPSAAPGDAASRAARRPSRRALIVGGAGTALAIVGGGLAWRFTGRRPAIPANVASLIDQAELALQQDSADGNAQAIGLYQRAVELQPGLADGWGGLALAYGIASHQASPERAKTLRLRAAAAADRAMTLEQGNAFARIARAVLLPRRGNWLVYERALRDALRDHPDNPRIMAALSQCLADVDRYVEAAGLLVRAVAIGNPSPVTLYERTLALWAANRLEEADQSSDEMFTLYPRHVGVWFTRLYMMMFTGRVDQAIAMANVREARPPGIPNHDFDIVLAAAHAIRSGSASDATQAMQVNIEAAHHGAGYAHNAIHFACALGRIDDAFMLAEALLLERGFNPGDLFFSEQQGSYLAASDRLTAVLFHPSAAPMRADPRFEALVREIGLTRYWAESGSIPDYKRRG